MRLGYIRGHVVLNQAIACLRGMRLAIVEPITAANLAAHNGQGGGKCLVAVDQLAAAEGQMVAFTEGREASNPFWPKPVPVDVYCALIVEHASFQPPADSGPR